MTANLTVRCTCGTVQGFVADTPDNVGTHVVCYCDDCQAFAHYLGRAKDILDEHGGTEIYQISPARLKFTAGLDRVAMVRLRPNGIARWYADCCKTPIGNTLPTPKVPLIGLIARCLHRTNETDKTDESLTVSDALGPVRYRVFGAFAIGDISHLNAHPKAPISAILSIAGKVLRRRLRGDHRHSPLFDSQTGLPIIKPIVLTDEQLQAVVQSRDGESG